MVNNKESKVIYQGNGETTEFPITFSYLSKEHVKVAIFEVATEKTVELVSDYFVDNVKNVVIYPGYKKDEEPPIGERPGVLQKGYRLVVYRDTPVDQLIDLGDKYPLKLIQAIVDKNTMLLQELRECLSRTLTIPQGSTDTATEVLYRLKEVYDNINSILQVAESTAKYLAEIQQARDTAVDMAQSAAETYSGLLADKENIVSSLEQTANKAEYSVQTNAESCINQLALLSAQYEDTLRRISDMYSLEIKKDAEIASDSAHAAAVSASTAAGYSSPAYDSNNTYNFPDVVACLDGYAYRCIGYNVKGDEPSTSSNWVRLMQVYDDFWVVNSEGRMMTAVNPTYSPNWERDNQGRFMTKR